MDSFIARECTPFAAGIEAACEMALTAAVTIKVRDDAREVRTNSIREWQSRTWATLTVTVVPPISTISWLQSN